jgi:hypothetical protein
MSSYSDNLSLIKVQTYIEVVVAAKDYDDAEKVVRENYGDIVKGMYKIDADVLDIWGVETVYELVEESPLRDYYPHGDEYGGQYSCEYYTIVEKAKREHERNKRVNEVQNLIASLDEDSLELLRNHFISGIM